MLEVNAALWNKIFRAELAKSLPKLSLIPRVFDDLFFSQLLYLNADRICFVPDPLVCYMIRKNAITGSIRPEHVREVRTAMCHLRDLCLQRHPERASYLDALAFLHLGISLMYRISSFGEPALKKALWENTAFLDAEFPGWRTSPFLRLSFVLHHRGANLKVYIVHRLCRLHLLRLFFRIYNSMIQKLGVDIKW